MAEQSNETQFALIKRELDLQNEKLDQILEQTTITNGRVTKLEGIVKWILGVGSALVIIIGFVVEYLSNTIGK